MKWLTIAAAGILSGAAGSMGIGGGGILIIFLTMFFGTAQIKAQGINLLFFIPIAVISIIIYAKSKRISWRTVLPLAAAGLIGVFVGVPLSSMLGDTVLNKIFAAILILISLKELFSRTKEV